MARTHASTKASSLKRRRTAASRIRSRKLWPGATVIDRRYTHELRDDLCFGFGGRLGFFEVGQRLFDGGRDADAVLGAEGVGLAVLDEGVGPADAHHGSGNAAAAEVFQDGAA